MTCPCCGQAVARTSILVDLTSNKIGVGWSDAIVTLPPRRAELAAILVAAAPAFVHREVIAKRLWGASKMIQSVGNNIGVNIYELRKDIAVLGLEIVSAGKAGYRIGRTA